MSHLFEDFHSINRDLDSPCSLEDPKLWYLASLVAEVAYYHIPEWEADYRKRLKFIPCDAYAASLDTHTPFNLSEFLGSSLMDLPIFVVVGRGIVAVGITTRTRLFIGFRGTLFLYHQDWRTNILADPVHLWSFRDARLHRGFAEEALRVIRLINHEIKSLSSAPSEIIFCGHSLGGAVASICANFADIQENTSLKTIVFGSPRCGNLAFHWQSGCECIHIRRDGDIIPLLPSKSKGYADYLLEFGVDGKSFIESPTLGTFFRRTAFFAFSRCEPHSMEGYRKSLGELSEARDPQRPLIDAELFPVFGPA